MPPETTGIIKNIQEKSLSRKKLIMFGMIAGSIAGGYAPSLFGVDDFMISLLCSTAGGLLGIWIGFRLA